MNEKRLSDYLDHIRRAATDACSFVDGLSKDEFLADKRTQQAVIMSLIIVGEAATKIMDQHVPSSQPNIPKFRGETAWVFDGEGWPTRKLDGTSCDSGHVFSLTPGG